ncbi:piggyBac transposable element-derived protein 4-like [Acyrthosiphon pisum]|uniref:PiggyBac transposable element-derived protein domain-containing protein n=1 Tax=Acyrthosiphon pisum TaxID=7029 RepID=A0A8R2F8S0_ACYPI|nr:piggyBac transposable element-derived protein 4-like [Acyrthosiphon pisum]|eukprot:XP_008181635.1 PREDICTED: piggyBac transposable element-derived protein 4-like [Acyrthosiphon pisum]
MSLQRFRFLIRCIRFDDLDTRIERKVTDKFSSFREIFDLFINNCKNNYSIGEFGTIDETLVAFRGRCPFKMYIPSKPAKYGIKVFSLVDAKMSYTYIICYIVYAGKQPPGYFDISNKPEDVVKRLCEPVFGTNRNITFDNWFTSNNLVQTMLLSHKLTIVGTIRKNKRELPT